MAVEYKIGAFLKRIKRPVSLNPGQDYKLVTIKMKHKGVVHRENKKGALIKSNMYEVRKGDFILSGIDARNGAFGIVPEELDGAIVTNDFWYFEIDEDIISKNLFLELTATSWFDEICKRGSDGTTQRIRLQKDKFFNQKVLLPDINDQEELLSKIIRFKESKANLSDEIQHQKDLLSKLKQSILQEAIQGKLTAEWRAKHPELISGENSAENLLKRIKAEKEQLVKEKKIKKEKPLPPIAEEEIPFRLPEGWKWCRIPEVLALTRDPLRRGPFGSSLKKDMFEPLSEETTKIYEQQNAIKKDYSIGNYYISTKKHPNLKSFFAGPGDIIISCAGTIGETYILPMDAPQGIINQALLKIRLNGNILLNEFFIFIFKAHLQGQVNSDAKGTAMKNMGSIKYLQNELFFGLPPLEEQKVIIEKVGGLAQKCKILEKEIATTEANAQLLMQAVLKEAFEVKEVEKQKELQEQL